MESKHKMMLLMAVIIGASIFASACVVSKNGIVGLQVTCENATITEQVTDAATIKNIANNSSHH